MSQTDLLISSAVLAILTADRPDGLPEEINLRAMGDLTAQQRPDLVAFCEDGVSPHPRLRQTTLVLRLRVRDDESPADDAAAWHAAAVDYFRANPNCLYATLLPHGITITKLTLGPYSDNAIAGRATEYDQRWKLWLEVEGA